MEKFSELQSRTLRSLDIVTSAYNEQESLGPLYQRICRVMEKYPNCKWRLLIADNNSSDQTWPVVKQLAASDLRVVAYRFSRKFNLDSALTCGLDLAKAEAIVLMCSDLQDPPELITKFIDGYEQGYDQVVGKVISREGASWQQRLFVKLFYRIINKLSKDMIRENVSDFRLASKACYEAARSLREQKRFLRGQFSWVGFKTQEVEFVRPNREFGESHFSIDGLKTNLPTALLSIFAHSSSPLFFLAILVIFLGGLSVVSLIACILFWLLWGVPFAGFGIIVSLLVGLIASVFGGIGLVAFYISAIYDEVKNRPLYVVSDSVNLK